MISTRKVKNSADEMSRCSLLLLRQAELLLSKCDALHQKRHISGKGSHCLKTLKILSRLTLKPSVDAVPVLA